MVDYWEEYKEMLFIAPFVLVAFVGRPILGGDFPIAFYGSIVFLGAGMFGFPYASEMQGGRLNVGRFNVCSKYEYGGNSVIQAWWNKPAKAPRRIPTDRWGNNWETDQPLIAPFPVHPKFGVIKTLTFTTVYYPTLMLKEQSGKVYYHGSLIDTSHVRLGTLSEYTSGPGIPITDNNGPRPRFMLSGTKGDYELLCGDMKVSQLKQIEAQIAA